MLAAQRGDAGRLRAHGVELVPQCVELRRAAGDLAAQRGQLGGALPQRAQLGAKRIEVGAPSGGVDPLAQPFERVEAGPQRLQVGQPAAQRLDLAAERGQIARRGVERGQLGAERLELAGAALELGPEGVKIGGAVAQRCDLAMQGLERRELVAQAVDAGAGGVGVAREVVEPAAVVARLGALDGDGGELLAQGVGLALDVVDPLQRGGELGAGGLGLARAVALEPLDRLGQIDTGGVGGLLVLVAGGLGDVERAEAIVGGLLGVEPGALEALEPGQQVAMVFGAQGGGLALGGLGAALGALARLLELGRQAERDPLELVDALHRRQQAPDHGGGVVEVGDRGALDARVEVGQAFLDLGVGLGARGLAARPLGRAPRRRHARAEDHERAGRAPALPRLRDGLERLAHRAHDHGVLGAHALQHQVHGELEAEVLQEQGEVEALVELDGDEDGLDRERVPAGVDAHDVDLAAGAGRLARLEEAPPGLGGGGDRRLDQRREERLAEHLGRRSPEQQLGRLGPLGHRALAVGQHEVAADDLAQDVVERVHGRLLGGLGHQVIRVDARGRVALDRGVHCLLYRQERPARSAIRREGRRRRGNRATPPPRPARPATW